MKYWTTKDGKEIAYKDLEDSHLLNILKWIEKMADEGLTFSAGGGSDPEDFWHEEDHLDHDEVLEHFDYQGLFNEAVKRGLFTKSVPKQEERN